MKITIVALGIILALQGIPLASAGIIYGTGQGGAPGGRDSRWEIVAVPGTFTPPDSQTMPYDSYILAETPWVFIGGSRAPWFGGGNQTGYEFDGITNYWIAPQSSASSIAPGHYNWICCAGFQCRAVRVV